MTRYFKFEKETKNTIRFEEIPDEDDVIMIGSLYIQKDALNELGYDYLEDTEIEVNIEIADS